MRNVEAKFRLASLQAARQTAIRIGFEPRDTYDQVDTFFITPRGKLKLRQQSSAGADNKAMLIYYSRDDLGGLKLADYEIITVDKGDAAHLMLAQACGVRAQVRKHRALLMRRNVRFHLDQVEKLGDFGELEAVLSESDSPEASRREVGEILAALGVDQSDLIEVSYFEMLDKRR